MRYQIIDGFRGFFLVFMCVIHMNGFTDVVLGKLNHHFFGWVEDAQGFVFISGAVVGLVYGKILAQKGFAAMRGKVFRRVGTIYSHQVGLILILFAGALILGAFGVYPAVLAPYHEVGIPFVVASALLAAASMHMGILPIYIFFMLAAPFVLLAIQRGHAMAVMLGSLFLWFFLGQSGALDAVTRAAEAALSDNGLDIELGIFFNVFGWQVLFFSGMCFGALWWNKKYNLDFMYEERYYTLFILCFVAFLCFGILDRVVFMDWLLPAFSDGFLALNSRQDFSPVYLISFFVGLFLVSWLLTAGRSCGVAFFEFCGALIQWLFTWRPLVVLGQHSLHVFSFHILLVYAAAIILEGRTVSEAQGGAILVLSVLSLYLPAYGHKWMQERERAARVASKEIA